MDLWGLTAYLGINNQFDKQTKILLGMKIGHLGINDMVLIKEDLGLKTIKGSKLFERRFGI